MQQAATSEDVASLLTTSAAARSAGISEGAIRAAATRGELACVRLGNGLRLFRPGDVAAWRAQRQHDEEGR